MSYGRVAAGLLAWLATAISSEAAAQQTPAYGATARVGDSRSGENRGRASTVVTRRDLDERLPRSAPDALRWEPGVYIQQTAHSQASPFVRGLTGQQVLMMFDGVRLNNGTYRQGPNQYLFTVDAASVDHLEVVRGSASVLYGSDAIGGAVLVSPLDPAPDVWRDGLRFHPRLTARAGTADGELGGRAQLGVELGPRVAAVAGFGYRDVGELRSGGPVRSPVDGSVPAVPLFRADGVTQQGTGFREATFDARVVARVRARLRAVAALYGYRQFDAPRTDQCPPPFQPEGTCLDYEEQYRTLAYAALRGDAGREIRDLDLVLSFQRTHERRRSDFPRANVVGLGRDDVNTVGIRATASTRAVRLADGASLRLRYGLDAYRDDVSSAAWLTFTDVGRVFPQSRGQYVDGSFYVSTGAFVTASVALSDWLVVGAGGRAAIVGVRTPPDQASGTRGVRQDFGAVLGRAGAEAHVTDDVTVRLNVDQGFRAPNLDDLTSRQATGPGFQLENADLGPERSLTTELGAGLDTHDVVLDAWAFYTRLDDQMTRMLTPAAACPPATSACATSAYRYQLVNAPGRSDIFGVEALARVRLPLGVDVRVGVAWAWGDQPNSATRPSDPAVPYDARTPLSRIPPLNGTFEARWRHPRTGLWAGTGIRWALEQDRLATSDRSDARIPLGGTPGYATVDLRVGWRWRDRVVVGAVLENVLDAAYRVHGSSVNGPGRSVVVTVSGGL